MNTQNQIELALSLWINGNRQEFKNIISKEKENILNYKGCGDVWTYFLPALLIEQFWCDMEDSGFPMERIVHSHYEVVSWLQWHRAVVYMTNKEPDFIVDFREDGLMEEQFSPMLFDNNSRNLSIILDYFNSGLRQQVEDAIEVYLNMTEENWNEIVDKLNR